jgi:hypothetical protein
MSDKATCPTCGAHTSALHLTGRCPNGCPPQGEDHERTAASMPASWHDWRAFYKRGQPSMTDGERALIRAAESTPWNNELREQLRHAAGARGIPTSEHDDCGTLVDLLEKWAKP